MNKKAGIYVAGHEGMVGSAMVRALRKMGFENLILKRYPELDLTRQDQAEAFLAKERPEYIIDAAARVGGILANNIYRAQFIYENLMIQNNLIHSAHKNGVKKLLFLGSSCIYPRFAPQPMKEEHLLTGTLEPTNEPYAIAKIAGIKMCENYYRQYGSDFISVMPTNLYGPYDNFSLETSHVLPALIRKLHLGRLLSTGDWDGIRADLEKRPVKGTGKGASEKDILELLSGFGINREEHSVKVTLWGTGKPLREFMHVEDMAAACIHVMEKVSASELYDELRQTHINIGTGEEISIAGLAKIISETTGFTGDILYDTGKPDGTPRKLMDSSLLNHLGYTAKISLREGIKRVYDWYLSS